MKKIIRKFKIFLLRITYTKPEINTRLCNDGSLNYQDGFNNRKIRFDGLISDDVLVYFHEVINDFK